MLLPQVNIKVRSGAADGWYEPGAPATWNTGGVELIAGKQTDTTKALAQFPCAIPAAQAAASVATLQLLCAADHAGGPLRVAAIDHFTDLAATAGTAAELAHVDIDVPAIAAGEVLSIDVLTLYQAIVADAAYDAARVLTFGLWGTDPLVAAFRFTSFDSGANNAPRLSITLDAFDDGEPNPYTTLYMALWDLLEASPLFCSLVAPGNRIRHGGWRDQDAPRGPEKDAATTADFPEVRIVLVDGDRAAPATNTTYTETLRCAIEIATGDQTIATLAAVRWAVMRALQFATRDLQGLTWGGAPFVLDVRPTVSAASLTDADKNRGVKGWSEVFAVAVSLKFSRTAIA